MSFSDSFINLNLMWVCHGTGYFETLIFPIPAVSTVHQRVLTVCFSCSSIKQIPSKYFLCLCAFHHRKTWTCWAGILSGRIQCWLYKGKGDRSQADHPVSLTVVSSWSDAHISVLCQMCVLQDGRVVLGGPGSFYWQGEVMGTSHTWVFWRGYWGFFFLDLKKMKKPHGEKEEPLSEVTSMFLLQCPNSHKLCL